MKPPPPELDWIEGFIERIRPYVYARLRDNVLIRMPNEAYKLNKTGTRVLHYLLNGGSVASLLKNGEGSDGLACQLNTFFSDLSRLFKGTVCDSYESTGLKRMPFELGYIELPVLSEVAVTNRCNIRCRFCYAACRCTSEPAGYPDRDELSTEEIKRVLSVIRHEAEVPSVSFTGGEPLLREDLGELIAYASGSLNMRVNLISNGTLISPAKAQEFKSAGLASAQVSLESPDPRIHDSLVRRPGAWRASEKGLRSLMSAGISVHFHTTICRMNLDSLHRMPSLASSLGLDRLSMNMVIPAGRGMSPHLAVRYSEMETALVKIMDAADRSGVRFLWYSPTPLCLFNPIVHGLGNKGCSACEGLLSIDPRGRLLPCSSWPEPLGNLLEQGFEELWFGERARFLRAKGEAPPGCRACEHFAVCNGACPLYFNVHGLDELEPGLRESTRDSGNELRSRP